MVRLESGVKFRVGGAPGVGEEEIVMEALPGGRECQSEDSELYDESNQLPPNDLKQGVT